MFSKLFTIKIIQKLLIKYIKRIWFTQMITYCKAQQTLKAFIEIQWKLFHSKNVLISFGNKNALKIISYKSFYYKNALKIIYF